MRARTLRTILLVKAIEESDRTGEILPFADRADATRAALRGGRSQLAARARRLLRLLAIRYPAVRHVGGVLEGAGAYVAPLLVLGILLGVALSTLDTPRRVNILAFPLAGLMVWNLFVYLALIATARRTSGSSPQRTPHAFTALLARLSRWRASRWFAHSAIFNVPLTEALRRFEADWRPIGRPLLLARIRRLLHLAAAAVAGGLIAGLYLRGIVLQYDAGWESTFLGPRSVHAAIRLIYGPAAALTGIPLPASREAVAALRWGAPAGSADAAPWIHLTAATVALYVILPRLALALMETLRLWHRSWRVSTPDSLDRYARSLFEPGSGSLAGNLVAGQPVACEPSAAARHGLETLLRTALGRDSRLEWQAPLRYGEEEALGPTLERLLAHPMDCLILIVSLAATPEVENHGLALVMARDALAPGAGRTRLLVLVDESAYAARLAGDPALAPRIDERRALWVRFAAGYGLAVCTADLERLPASPPADHPAAEALRRALAGSRA